MKKAIGVILFIIIFFGIGTANAAVFTKNLYFGLEKDNEVMKLQELLASEGVYSGPITGNFYSLTLNGVKAFQNKYGIVPVGGFFGPLTRGKANTIIDSQLRDSESQAIMETGSISPTPTPQADPTQLQLSALLAQLELLQKQLNAQQQAVQGTQNSPMNTTTTQPPTTAIVLPNNPQPTPTPTTPQTTPSLEPLVFTQTPKLVFKNLNVGNEGIAMWALSYITWGSNRPSTLVISPIFPDASGWTTAGGAWESCGRAGVSHDINSTCKIKVIDGYGNTAEYSLEVFKDSIDL